MWHYLLPITTIEKWLNGNGFPVGNKHAKLLIPYGEWFLYCFFSIDINSLREKEIKNDSCYIKYFYIVFFLLILIPYGKKKLKTRVDLSIGYSTENYFSIFS